MAHINFIIPQNKSELLCENDAHYYVHNICGVKEIRVKLQEAKGYLKDEGAEFILENFDIYYSVIHHTDALPLECFTRTFEDLHKATESLNNALAFLLEDKDNLNEELNSKFINIIKMLLYVYINLTISTLQKIESKRSSLTATQKVGRNRKNQKTVEDDYGELDKKSVLVVLNNIIDQEINQFWDPPVLEETFVNMISEVCYRFLEIPSIKNEKEIRVELFNLLGTLIKKYNHGMTFVVRLVQLIKLYDHVVACVPDGIQLLVTNYNCKSLVRDLVREVTEWQTDEKYQDAQGTRHCSNVLLNMANLMPDLMIPEVIYLNRYLAHDSYTLRNSVLGVITEVILNVLTKPDLTDEERESRNEFLEILEEHLYDTSAFVRSKVFQHWARLQQENAIPQAIQPQILQKAIFLLQDKAANVRKCACNCVTTFVSHNIFSSKLQLSKMEIDLVDLKKNVDEAKASLEQNRLEKLKEIEVQWNEKEQIISEIITSKLKEEAKEITFSQIPKESLPMLVRLYITENKFEEAFKLCQSVGEIYQQWTEAKANLSQEQEVQLFLQLMRTIFMDLSNQNTESEKLPNELEINNINTLQNTFEYLEAATNFLRQIDSAMTPMTELLESQSIIDMQEAIEFFVVAYQFNVDNCLRGILEMLRIMQRNEQERKDAIIKAFKRMYLTTDSSNMGEHTETIVRRLIQLLQILPFENIQDLEIIISQLVSNGSLDNSVLKELWDFFVQKGNSDESRAALALLKMASIGRPTIIKKNHGLVANIAFETRGKEDLLLVSLACQILLIDSKEKQDLTNPKPPYKRKIDDAIWKNLENLLSDQFFKKNPDYNVTISSAIEFIYGVCSKPEIVCESLIERILKIIQCDVNNNDNTVPSYIIAQVATLVGKVALEELNFLDDCVFKELKRRNYIREDLQTDKKSKKSKKKPCNVTNASSASKINSINTTNESTNDSSIQDESVLEGAQANDTDAEFILNVLENNIVNDSFGMEWLMKFLVCVVERPDVYDDVYVQGTVITALLRCMMVSSKCCERYKQLVFTILERSKFPEVKVNIIIQCSDLLERFPNIIEPWLPILYARLNDSCIKVRISTFYMLSNLLLRDMIRIQGYISKMALCMVDNDVYLKSMSKHFFLQLSHKANNLYNILPEIFSQLLEVPNISEENLQFIMKYLFGLIDKNKYMESLVDRFCSKFRLTEDEFKCRNIAFCLSMLNYNEKGLRRLIDHFGDYRNTLQQEDVYSIFMQIIAACNRIGKNEIKELTDELQEQINSVFEIGEDGAPKVPRFKEKPVFKKPRGKAPRKKQKTKSRSNDSDESIDDDCNNENSVQVTPLRKSTRKKRNTPRKAAKSSDSDSE